MPTKPLSHYLHHSSTEVQTGSLWMTNSSAAPACLISNQHTLPTHLVQVAHQHPHAASHAPQCSNTHLNNLLIYSFLTMGHIVSSLHLLKEIIFFSCVSLTQFFFFKLGLCLFLYPYSLYFSPKLFFLFLQGEKLVFQPMLFIGGVVSIFYRVELFCVPLILYFLLSFIAYVYSLQSCLCQYVTKRGRYR